MLAEFRHHVVRQQAHRFALPRRIGAAPIEAGHQQGAERAHLLAEGDELVEHGLRRAVGHACARDDLRCRFLIGHVGPWLEPRQKADAVEHLAHIREEVGVRAGCAEDAVVRLRVGWRHQDVAGDAPIVAVRRTANFDAGLAVGLPMARDGISRDDIGGDDAPALERGGARRRRLRACERDRDRRAPLLVRFGHEAHPQVGQDAILDLDVPELALERIGRILRPDALHEIHGLDHHAVARMHVGILEQLEIRDEAAWSDAEHETALAHVIELRRLGGNDRGMMVGNVDDRGAEGDVSRAREEIGEEHQGRGNGLGGGGEMLAQPQLLEAELVGEQRLLRVLVERAPEGAVRRMHRHHEHTETHEYPP